MRHIFASLFVLALVPSMAKATEQKDLTLSEKCREVIVDAVFTKYGVDDETFSVVGTKLLYGGSIGGLHYSPVVMVRTSDEVEPRDVLVVTSWVGSEFAEKFGCKVISITTVTDGLVLGDDEDFVPAY